MKRMMKRKEEKKLFFFSEREGENINSNLCSSNEVERIFLSQRYIQKSKNVYPCKTTRSEMKTVILRKELKAITMSLSCSIGKTVLN